MDAVQRLNGDGERKRECEYTHLSLFLRYSLILCESAGRVGINALKNFIKERFVCKPTRRNGMAVLSWWSDLSG
jgi:hypothetical protein